VTDHDLQTLSHVQSRQFRSRRTAEVRRQPCRVNRATPERRKLPVGNLPDPPPGGIMPPFAVPPESAKRSSSDDVPCRCPRNC
jgi:hypothetical protein